MPQIIEAVLFNNELELLEARLHEGGEIVDHWVIIESRETFTGHPKRVYTDQIREMFPEFSSRILGIEIVPAPEKSSPWVRETRQRDALSEYLPRLKRDDLIVLSDGDELTRASSWPEIIESTAGGQSVSLHKPSWYYTLTWALPDDGPAYSSFRTKATRVCDLRRRGSVAHWAGDMSYPVLGNSGWHLSCLGGPARLLDKIRSFSHQEINTEEWATYENCRRLIQDGVDCVPERGLPLTRTDPAGPEWLITEGVVKYPWLLTGEDPCIPAS